MVSKYKAKEVRLTVNRRKARKAKIISRLKFRGKLIRFEAEGLA